MLLAGSGGAPSASSDYFSVATATLLSTLDSAGLLSRIDALYDLGQPTEAESLVNLVNPGTYDLTKTGTVTFTPNIGAISDGSTGYLDCGFAPATASNFTQNSASLALFLDTPSTSQRFVLGLNGSDRVRLGYFDVASGISARLNNNVSINTSASGNLPVEDATFAFLVASRTTANQINLYLKGNETPLGSSGASASQTLRAENFNIFRSATQIAAATQVLRIAIIMNGLSSSEQATLHTAIRTYVEATESRYFLLVAGGQSNADRLFRDSASIGSGDGSAGSNAADRVLIPELQGYLDAHYNDGRRNTLVVENVAVGGSSVMDDDLNANIHWVETGPTDGTLLTSAKTSINNIFDIPERKAKYTACMIWDQGGADVEYVVNKDRKSVV
jgi:hypothetical protein